MRCVFGAQADDHRLCRRASCQEIARVTRGGGGSDGWTSGRADGGREVRRWSRHWDEHRSAYEADVGVLLSGPDLIKMSGYPPLGIALTRIRAAGRGQVWFTPQKAAFGCRGGPSRRPVTRRRPKVNGSGCTLQTPARPTPPILLCITFRGRRVDHVLHTPPPPAQMLIVAPEADCASSLHEHTHSDRCAIPAISRRE